MTAADYRTLKHARRMRHEPTEAERRLWNQLRNRSLGGFKFSRQVPLENYIVDFVCKERKLVIEVDGVTHGDRSEVNYDERRTAWLKSKGFKVHRVWNQDVYDNLDGVLDTIVIELSGDPSPARLRELPSPASGRGER